MNAFPALYTRAMDYEGALPVTLVVSMALRSNPATLEVQPGLVSRRGGGTPWRIAEGDMRDNALFMKPVGEPWPFVVVSRETFERSAGAPRPRRHTVVLLDGRGEDGLPPDTPPLPEACGAGTLSYAYTARGVAEAVRRLFGSVPFGGELAAGRRTVARARGSHAPDVYLVGCLQTLLLATRSDDVRVAGLEVTNVHRAYPCEAEDVVFQWFYKNVALFRHVYAEHFPPEEGGVDPRPGFSFETWVAHDAVPRRPLRAPPGGATRPRAPRYSPYDAKPQHSPLARLQQSPLARPQQSPLARPQQSPLALSQQSPLALPQSAPARPQSAPARPQHSPLARPQSAPARGAARPPVPSPLSRARSGQFAAELQNVARRNIAPAPTA